jgi:Tfp pilus assembly protein PilW
MVAMVISGVLLAGFTAFYLSEQRGVRHHQIEIETSHALRTALEQMSRELRSARKDITRDFLAGSGGASPTFLTWNATQVEFELDANDDGDKTDAGEHKGFPAERIDPGTVRRRHEHVGAARGLRQRSDVHLSPM